MAAQNSGLVLPARTVSQARTLADKHDYVRVRNMVVEKPGDIRPAVLLAMTGSIRESVRLAPGMDQFGNPRARKRPAPGELFCVRPHFFRSVAQVTRRRGLNINAATFGRSIEGPSPMNIPLLSTTSIVGLHGRIGWCLAHDDARPVHAREYGVREDADWRLQADEFQAELHRRGVPFSPIAW